MNTEQNAVDPIGVKSDHDPVPIERVAVDKLPRQVEEAGFGVTGLRATIIFSVSDRETSGTELHAGLRESNIVVLPGGHIFFGAAASNPGAVLAGLG